MVVTVLLELSLLVSHAFAEFSLMFLTDHLGTAYYDSMLVKCTCHGSTYEIARRKVLRALVEFRIRGLKTNIPFLASLLTHPTFIDSKCWTTFIDDTPELFKLIGSQNRAQKLLGYLGEIVVNGPQVVGQIGESKFKGEAIIPTLLDKSGKAIDTSKPCETGWRNIITEQGPEAFAKAVRKNKGCLIMDTTWRDAHQSLLATRMRTIDFLNIAKETSYALSNAWALECWGGATFDVAMRFLYEDPWDRLRKMRKAVPNIPFQMLLRGANGVAYSSLPDNAIYHFCEQAKKNGMDIFRVFDALNDMEQLEVGVSAVLKAGGVAEGTVCYSGDMLVSFISRILFASQPDHVETLHPRVDLMSNTAWANDFAIEPREEVQPGVLHDVRGPDCQDGSPHSRNQGHGRCAQAKGCDAIDRHNPQEVPRSSHPRTHTRLCWYWSCIHGRLRSGWR